MGTPTLALRLLTSTMSSNYQHYLASLLMQSYSEIGAYQHSYNVNGVPCETHVRIAPAEGTFFLCSELSAILRFGAEELFKEEKNEEESKKKLLNLDIDEILERAEKVEDKEVVQGEHELLTGFKFLTTFLEKPFMLKLYVKDVPKLGLLLLATMLIRRKMSRMMLMKMRTFSMMFVQFVIMVVTCCECLWDGFNCDGKCYMSFHANNRSC